MPTPLVSVIIPVYNCAGYLPKALSSVLLQDAVTVEVLLVDSSTDGSCASISKHADSRVRYMYQQPRGVSAARNLGIQHAQGEYIAFQDADDEWLPGKLSMQIAALQRYPDAGLVFTDTMICRDGDVVQATMNKNMLKEWCKAHTSPVPDWYYGNVYAALLARDCMNTSSVVVPRKVLEVSGNFDESFKIGEDYDLWLRIARRHPMVYIDRVLSKYQVRADGLSGGDDLSGVRWLEAHLAVREKHKRSNWIPAEHVELLNDVLSQLYWEIGWSHFGHNRFLEARKCFWKGLRARPLYLRNWLYWCSSFLPVSLVQAIRSLRQVYRKATITKAYPLHRSDS